MREALRTAVAFGGAVLRAADSPKGIFLSGVSMVAAGTASYSLPVAAIVTGCLFLVVVFMGAWPRQPRGER